MTGQVDEISPEDVSRTWPVSTPRRVSRIGTGTNNRSFIVTCDGRRYFLKGYDNDPDPARCLFEHRITAAIAARQPPFAVPEIILSRSSRTHVRLRDRSFALTTFIAGSTAALGDPDDATASGRALADLHAALATVDPGAPEAGASTFENLATVHPLVPEPERALREAIGDDTLAEKATAILTSTEARWRNVTSSWPLTWIHWDFYPANVLLLSHRVTGVVDFEFAGAGHRAMDVAIGLYAFALERGDSGILVDRFASGYLGRMELSPEEIEAIPLLILMREATSLVHWTGRYYQGLTTSANLEGRAWKLVRLAGFVDQNGAGLVERLHETDARRH